VSGDYERRRLIRVVVTNLKHAWAITVAASLAARSTSVLA
jgi:hypothetical protein